jgi:phosphate transport system substrate-binding protein
MKKPLFAVVALLITASIILTACGGQEVIAPPQTEPTVAPQTTDGEMGDEVEEETAKEKAAEDIAEMVGVLPAVDPLALSGDVVTAGSSTVFPLAEAMAARFQDEGFSGRSQLLLRWMSRLAWLSPGRMIKSLCSTTWFTRNYLS